jgi:Tol biopolymer transport system component
VTRRYKLEIAPVLLIAVISACGKDSVAPPTTGTLEINVVTTGVDIDPDGFALEFNGRSLTIPANGIFSVSALPGTYPIGVSGPAFNCDLTAAPTSANVVLATTTRVEVQASCKPFLSNVIVYVSQEFGLAEVVVMRPDGSRRQRLTTDQATRYAAPVVSPDGQSIAVSSGAAGGSWDGIYLLDRFGRGRTKLVGRSTFDGSPAWSPDGTKLAFRSLIPGGPTSDYSRIFIVNRDGTGLRQLTPDTTDPNLYVFDANPSWSPDGSRLIFTRNGVLHLINADGSGLASTGVSGDSPSWSPDGTQIAYETLNGGKDGLFAMDMSFTSRRLTTPVEADQMPRWSPDGSQIVFARVEAGVFHIYKMGADGSGVTKLSAVPQNDVFPSWSRNF